LQKKKNGIIFLAWIIRHHGNRSADYADYRRLRIDN